MGLTQFVRERRSTWDRLEQIIGQVYKRGARRANADDVHQMIHLYREASADLARLRAMDADPQLIDQINRLVTRGHAQIYRGVGKRPRSQLRRFFLRQYPRLFRATWRFTLASLLCSAVFYCMAYYTVQQHPDIVADLMGGGQVAQEFQGSKTRDDIAGRFENANSPIFSSFVTTNNIKVAFNAFALGITFGLGTVYVLVFNGTMLGGFAGAYAQSGIESAFWLTVLPHGALELSAIVVAGGSGLLMGYALWVPGRRTRRRALREEAIKAVQLVLGLVPAFILAGLMEGFVTPRTDIPQGLKVALGVALAVSFWGYLLLAGRQHDETDDPAGAG